MPADTDTIDRIDAMLGKLERLGKLMLSVLVLIITGAIWAAKMQSDLASEQFLVSVLLSIINDKKRQNIIAKGEQIIAAAQSLPDEKRLQFTAAVEAAYTQVSQ